MWSTQSTILAAYFRFTQIDRDAMKTEVITNPHIYSLSVWVGNNLTSKKLIRIITTRIFIERHERYGSGNVTKAQMPDKKVDFSLNFMKILKIHSKSTKPDVTAILNAGKNGRLINVQDGEKHYLLQHKTTSLVV